MPKREYSFDPDCLTLAEHFLPSDSSEEQRYELAQEIQDTVESYCEALEQEQGDPPAAPADAQEHESEPAPAFKECSACGRKSYEQPQREVLCWTTLQDGSRCSGTLRPVAS